MLTTGQKLVAENDVVNGLYSKFGPMLFRQTPYTMVKNQRSAEDGRDNVPESRHSSVWNEQ